MGYRSCLMFVSLTLTLCCIMALRHNTTDIIDRRVNLEANLDDMNETSTSRNDTDDYTLEHASVDCMLSTTPTTTSNTAPKETAIDWFSRPTTSQPDSKTDKLRMTRSQDTGHPGREKLQIGLDDERVRSVIEKYDDCFYHKGVMDTCRTQRFCLCDEYCGVFADCCIDVETRRNRTNDQLLQPLVKRLEVVTITTEISYRFVTSCEPEIIDTSLVHECTNINNSDVLSLIPVYDTKFELSFRNIHCARCNKVNPTNLQFWEISIKCKEYLQYTQAGRLVDYLNHLLSTQRCRMSYQPYESFRMVQYPGYYKDGYQCDDHNITEEAINDTHLATSESLTGISVTTPNLFSNHKKPSTEHAYFSNQNLLKSICLRYANFYTTKVNRKTVYYKNPVCTWCKRFPQIRCLSSNHELGKIKTFSIFIKFHTAEDAFNGRETQKCKENEIHDSLHNECRHLMCNSHRIASYGKCQEPYSSVDGPYFPFMMYTRAPCTNISVKMTSRAVKRFMEETFINEPFLMRSFAQSGFKKINQTLSGNEYCSRYCSDITFRVRMTRERVSELNKFFSNIFEIRSINNVAIASRSQMKSVYLNCIAPMETEYVDIIPCPYITMNISEFQKFADATKAASISVPDNTYTQHINTYLICYHTYKKLLQSLKGGHTVYQEKQLLLKSVLSLTLVSLSLILLIVSSVIYAAHPGLKTIPCHISFHTMLCLTVTCLLFIFTNIFDSNPNVCYVLAILNHYTWLCVFMWSVLFGYHTVIILGKMPLPRGPKLNARNSQRILRPHIYNVIAYVTPFVVCTSTVVLDKTNTYILDYGIPNCFINNKNALFLTFAVPVISMFVLNTSFFIISAVKLFTFSRTGTGVVEMKTNVFTSTAKLSLCLGLTWIFGILASFTENEIFWYLHILFNSSHGIFFFFVLVVFSKTVRPWLKSRCCLLNTSET